MTKSWLLGAHSRRGCLAPRLLDQSSVVTDPLAIVYLYVQSFTVLITCSSMWVSFFLYYFPLLPLILFFQPINTYRAPSVLMKLHQAVPVHNGPPFIGLIVHRKSVQFCVGLFVSFLLGQGGGRKMELAAWNQICPHH